MGTYLLLIWGISSHFFICFFLKLIYRDIPTMGNRYGLPNLERFIMKKCKTT